MVKILVLFLCLFVVSSCSDNPKEFVGSYSGAELEAQITKNGDTYEGSLKKGSSTYPLKATLTENMLKGSFTVEGEEFSFEADIKENELTLISSNTTYKLTRNKAKNPLAKQETNKTNPLAKKPTVTKKSQLQAEKSVKVEKGWKTYTHNTGLKFDYPPTWTVPPTQEGISIVPPGVAKDPQGQPLEAIILGSVPADGIKNINSPKVSQFFDTVITQMLGSINRQGQLQYLDSQIGKAVFFNYSGRSNTNVDVNVGIYCVLYENYGVYLMHDAAKKFYGTRSAETRKIFNSIRMPKKTTAVVASGNRDSSLIGSWSRRESSYSSSYGGGPSVGSETNLKMVFNANGQVAYGSGTVVFGGGNGVSVHSGQANPNMSYGVWTTENEVIHIKWNDGSSGNYQYSVFQHNGGIAAKIVFASGKKYFIKQ